MIGNAPQRAAVATVIDGETYYVSANGGAATRIGPVLVFMESELRFKCRDRRIGRPVDPTWEGFRIEMESDRRFLFAVVYTENGLLPTLEMYAGWRS